jgi:hypothetical protein
LPDSEAAHAPLGVRGFFFAKRERQISSNDFFLGANRFAHRLGRNGVCLGSPYLAPGSLSSPDAKSFEFSIL